MGRGPRWRGSGGRALAWPRGAPVARIVRCPGGIGGSETTMTCAGRPGSVGAFASVAQRQRIVREALIRPWMGPRRLAYEVGGGAVARDRWLRDNSAPPHRRGAAHGGYRRLDGGYPGQRRWPSNAYRGEVAKARRAVHVSSPAASPNCVVPVHHSIRTVHVLPPHAHERPSTESTP